MAKILIIEDHENLRIALKECIEKEGYQVEVAENLQGAKAKLSLGPDLVVLDWMLPDGQGLDFLVDLRRRGHDMPVLFLTARTELVDKVLGLELGASDYLTKPFEPRELLARIRVRLRERASIRSHEAASPSPDIANAGTIKVGNLIIDRIRHHVSFRGVDVELVKKEFELLALLAEEPGKVFSRDEILNKVWGYDIFPTTRTVDTHVMQLRQKIHADLIETVRAVGYRLIP
jgi:DNA-binding response OmpR family regulator